MELEGYSEFSLIGSGGNAHVYRASSDVLNQQVAVKILRGAGDEAVNRRFERERKLMGELQEIDGVVPILESGVTPGGDPYLAMPLYEGGSLQTRLTEDPLEWELAVSIARSVAGALANAHSKRILHLDVKPANVLLDDEGAPWLGDFGIAEMMGSTASMSAAMMTPAYTPPERLRDAKPSEQTDIYGLGATLFALLAGTAPFGSEDNTNPASVMMSVLNDPVPIERLPHRTPESLTNLVLRCMSKNPSERPASADEMVTLLDVVSEGGEVLPPPSSGDHDDHLTVAVGMDTDDVTVARNTAGFPYEQSGLTTQAADLGQRLPLDEEDDDKRKGVWILAAAALVVVMGLGVGAAFALGGGEDPVVSAESASSGSNSNSEVGDSQEADGDSEVSSEVVPEVAGEGVSEVEQDAEEEGDADGSGGESGTALSAGSATAGAVESPSSGVDPVADQSVGVDPVSPPVTRQQEPTEPTVTSPTTPDSPTARFTSSSTSVEVGDSVRFTNSSTGSGNTYRWEFGDGTTSSQTNPSHSYSRSGTFTVTLTASNAGGSRSTTRTVAVAAVQDVAAPSAAFTSSSLSVQAGESVTFTDSSTGAVSSVSWTFSDGGASSGSSATHRYSTAGSFQVTMKATGPGGTDSATKTVNVAAVAVDPPPRPDNEGCQYLGNDVDVQWAFSPLPALVDTYLLEFSDGSRRDIGSQPGPFTTTDNSLRKIIAERDGVENALSVGSCEQHGGTKPVVGSPALAQNVRCRFHDFFYNDAGTYTWSETWNWSAGADTTSFTMVINQDGSIQNVNNGASTSHVTVGVNGQSNSGRSVKGIISNGPGGSTTLTIANCGAMNGTGWQNPPGR